MSLDLEERLARIEAGIDLVLRQITAAAKAPKRGAPKVWISATEADDAAGWRHGETRRRAEAGRLISREKKGRGPRGRVLLVRRADVLAELERAP